MQLVPYPQKLIRHRGSFCIEGADLTVSVVAGSSPAVKHALKILAVECAVNSVPANDPLFNEGFSIDIGNPTAKQRSPQRAEAYSLCVDRSGIRMRGFDADGISWALVTLKQLLGCGTQVPCVEIKDFPEFGLRYHHDDISRKQVSTLADFKRVIRHLSQFKIKYYTPYMEDMLFLKRHPDIGVDRGRLMPNEIKAMHAEAKKYNVCIFPTYSLIGHQENLLRMPQYQKYAQAVFQKPSAYDPRKKILRPYLKTIIADVCEHFPDAPYFHACFDEIQGLPTQVIVDHANWCAQELSKHANG